MPCYDIIGTLEYQERVTVTIQGHPGLVITDGGARVEGASGVLGMKYLTTRYQTVVQWFGPCLFCLTAVIARDTHDRKYSIVA